MDARDADAIARAILIPNEKTHRVLELRARREACMRARRLLLIAGLAAGAAVGLVLIAIAPMPATTASTWSLLAGLGTAHVVAAWRHPLPRD